MQKWLISAQSLNKSCRHKSLVVPSGLHWEPKKLRLLCESRNFSFWNDRAQPEHGLTRTQTLLSDFKGHSCFSSMVNSAWIFFSSFPASIFPFPQAEPPRRFPAWRWVCFDLAQSTYNDGSSLRNEQNPLDTNGTSFCFVVYHGVIFCECGQSFLLVLVCFSPRLFCGVGRVGG